MVKLGKDIFSRILAAVIAVMTSLLRELSHAFTALLPSMQMLSTPYLMSSALLFQMPTSLITDTTLTHGSPVLTQLRAMLSPTRSLLTRKEPPIRKARPIIQT